MMDDGQMQDGLAQGGPAQEGPWPRGARRGRLRRAVGAAALAATLGLVSLPTVATVQSAGGTAALVDWSSRSGWPDRGYDAGPTDGSSTSTTDVDSDPATDDESTGVVLIDTELAYEGAAGAGTGVVLTSDGEVLTNYHVVEGATAIKVTVATTGTTYTATVVGHSASSDVALLQLAGADGLATATIDDDTVALGDDVTAVGNAGGTGTLTAADGTVTDLDSSITTASEGSVASEDLRGLVETDADVVPGDSGGPLLDDEGEVVGIDTAASSGTSSSTIDGYAVPIEDALAVVRQIRSGDETSTVQVGANAFLGVQVSDTAAAYAQPGSGHGYGAAYGATAAGGAAVAGVVDGSPAAQAGLAVGDTITAVGSTAVGSATALSAALAPHEVGDQVRVTWTDASGTSHDASVTLAASPTA
jgi:S1-C subfamily serine protease